MQAKFTRRALRAAYVIGALVVIGAPAIATSNVWAWKDQSNALPFRDGVSISSISERQGNFLVTDGSHLYRFDGAVLTDLTKDARSHGLLAISTLASDGRNWLIGYQPIDSSAPSLWLTDGLTWTDVAGKFRLGTGGMDAVGNDGVWYVRTFTKATAYQPSSWDLSLWNGSNSIPSAVTIPSFITPNKAGCLTSVDGSKLCTGVSGALNINGSWYFVGGTSESRGANNITAQPAKAGLWKLNGSVFASVANLPSFHFVSGVWTSKNQALIATSNSATNPFAADHLWVFDGTSMRNISAQALGQGLLSVDAREIHAAYDGRSWMILIGKKQIRFNGTQMTDAGSTKDSFESIASDGNGLFVLGGAVSDATHLFATSPLTAKLTTVTEDLSAPETAEAPSVVSGIAGSLAAPVIPAGQNYTRDASSGIQWLTWTTPNVTHVKSGDMVTYNISAQAASLQGIDIWVNGLIKQTCHYPSSNKFETCSVTLYANDLPYGAESFMNANIKAVRAAADKSFVATNAWTTGTRLNRDVNTTTVSATNPTTNVSTNVSTGPNFSIRASIDPNVTDVKRGNAVTFKTVSQNNTVGLQRVEVMLNGAIHRTCTYGAAMSNVSCDDTVDTSGYPEGNTLSFTARAIDINGHEVWSDAKSVFVRSTTVAQSVKPAANISNPMSVWEWLTPSVGQLVGDGQTAVYTASAWSPNGINRIEMIVDGSIKRTCGFGNASGNKECAFTISTDDYSHGHTVVVNARVVDGKGQILWTDARAILIKRNWEPLNDPGAYVTITADKSGSFATGDVITFQVKGWSPNGVNHLDLFVNGAKAMTCPNDVCTWKSPTQSVAAVEYQARVVDNMNQSTWTGLYGLIRK